MTSSFNVDVVDVDVVVDEVGALSVQSLPSLTIISV